MTVDLFGDTKEDHLERYFMYWRSNGFPNYNKGYYNKQKELNDLIIFDEKSIRKNNIIKQTMHSLGFLWSYFPEWIDVRYGDDPTIRELWKDDLKLKELIRKTYEYGQKHNEPTITENRLRQNAKVYLSKQSVSNFRPTVAKYIYNTYGNNGTVWDMSCGWGGRLFGFMASNCKKYIGTEPNTQTFKGLTDLKNDYKGSKVIELLNICSEDYLPKENSLDLCFTSPPYYDTEKYSEEPTQSYIKHPSKEKWLNGFYKKTMWNCYDGLKTDGYMIINIANTPKYDFLEQQTKNMANDLGFSLVDTLKMELSSISGNGVKYEPIFIFKKT